MADEYQFRKEIDALKRAVDNIDVSEYVKSDEVNTQTNKLYSDLDVLSTDLTDFYTTLNHLRDNLIGFNQELIDFDEDNDNFASDLSKLKDNLHSFIGAVNKLSTDLTGLDSSLDGLETDVDGLGTSVEGLVTAVGDNNSGLVKGLNDLSSNVDDLSDDVFGDNGLSSQLSSLEGVINNPTTGLSAQVNGLDNRVFGTGGLSDSIFGTNGLASRITTAEGGLSTLVSSLDVLSGFLTEFEGELEDFETELENDPDIDTSQLNSTIVALFGVIADVKGNVDTVDGQLSDVSNSFDNVKTNLYGTKTVNGETVPKEPSDTASSTSLRGHLDTLKDTTVPAVQTTLYGGGNNSPSNPSANSLMGKTNAVKADLYGTKTVNGQTVPREPSDTASPTSLSGNLTTLREETIPAVQVEIFGSDANGDPLNMSNYSDTSLLGRADTVHDDIYGENGTPSNYTETSVKGRIHKVTDQDIPAVQKQVYGEGTTPFLCTNSWEQYTIDTSDLTGTGAISFRTYATSIVDIKTIVGTGISNGNFASNFTNWERNDTTSNIAIGTESSTNYVRMKAEYTSANIVDMKSITQKNINLSNLNSISFYARKGTPQTDANQGTLVVFVGDESKCADGLYTNVDTVAEDIDTAQTHIGNLQTISYGGEGYTMANPKEGSLKYDTDTALNQLGDPTDTNTGTIFGDIHVITGNVSDVRDDVGTVNRSVDGSLQQQIIELPSNYEKIWVCPTNSTIEISKMVEEGNARIGLKISELGKKSIRDSVADGGYGIKLPLRIVSPSGEVSTPYSDIYISSVNAFDSNDNIYASYNFSEYGVYKIFSESLSYTFQVGENISDLTLKSSQTAKGMTVKVYCDGLNVYVTYDARPVTGLNTSSTNDGVTDILTLSNTKYAPLMQTQVPARGQADTHRIRITTDGRVQFLNGSASATSYTVTGALYYPLKRRIKTPAKIITTTVSNTIFQKGENNEIHGELKYGTDIAIPNTRVHFFVKEDQ